MENISLLIVDDHKMVREGLKSVFDDDDRYTVTETAHHGMEALDFLKRNTINVILTEINMPVVDGVEFIRTVKKDAPDQGVIALTMLGES